MKRLKSIDIMRGGSIIWMIIGHLIGWGIRSEDFNFFIVLRAIGDVLGSGAFLFVAGMSTMLSYRNRLEKVKTTEEYNIKMIRNEYIFRALIILTIAMIYNILTGVAVNIYRDIWKYFILLTVALSLFMAWPLLKTSKIFRILIGAIFWIIHYFMLDFLINFKGQLNIYGVLFHVLYNSLDLDPLISFFTFFLIGTVIGDVIFDTYLIKNQKERRIALKNKLLLPSLIMGALLIMFGIIFNFSGQETHFVNDVFLDFPAFLQHRSFSWLVYSLGIHLILISVLLGIEEFEIIKTEKSYKFIFYFSYYSLTVYLAHFLLFLAFFGQLNVLNALISSVITIALIGVLLRAIYKKWKGSASIKVQIGRLSSALARKIKEKN